MKAILEKLAPQSGEAKPGSTDVVQIPCMECGKPFLLDGFIARMVMTWNAEEIDQARAQGRPSDRIRQREIAPCPACLPEVRRRRDEQSERDNTLTQIWLRDLRAGRYDADSIRWLRARGHSKDVDAQFAKEGSHANAQ